MKVQGFFKSLVILISAYFCSFVTGGRIPYLIFYICLGLLIVDIIWAGSNTGVSALCWIEASSSQVGSKIKVFTEVRNNSPCPVPWVQCWIEMPGTFCLPDNLCCYTFSLGPNERKVVSEELECKMRGKFLWGTGVVRTGGFMGVFTANRTFGEAKEIQVLPQIYKLGSVGCFSDNTEISGIRKYDSTDGISRIHWKISAKTQHLFVKEHHQKNTIEYMIILDNSRENHSSEDPDGSFEKSVSLIASVAAAAARAGHGAGLFVCGHKNVTPGEKSAYEIGYGQTNFKLILKTLIEVSLTDDEMPEEAIKRIAAVVNKRAHLLLITGRLDSKLTEILVRQRTNGRRCTVFLMKPETFGVNGSDMTGREKAVLRLRSSGVRVIPVDSDSDLRLVLGRPEYGVG